MNRLAFTTFSCLTIIGTLAGCSSSPQSNQPTRNQANAIQGNETDNQANTSSLTNSFAPANDSNSVATNRTSNSTDTTIPPQADGLQFAKYIAQAMEQVMSRTKMPAIFAPTQPTFQPQAAFVGVSESASDWNYTVRLYATPTSVPLNDPSIGQLSAASFMGMFSGKYYGSHEAAMKELASEFYVKKVGPASSIDTGGVMKQYSTGQQYNTGGSTNYQLPQDVIEWQMGRWKIDVFGAPSIDFINEAKQVDSFIQTHALPPTDGRILINPHATGNPVTQIGWVFGNELFECDCPSPTMTQILDALRMAVSMREYDSDKVTP